METLERGGFYPDTVFQPLFPEIRAPRPSRDCHTDRVRTGMQATLAFADEDQWSDVALFQLIGAHGSDARLHDLCGRKRNLQAKNVGRVEQTVDVLDQTEDGRTAVLTGITPDSLEYANAVVQSMSEDMYLGFVPGHQGAVHPDLAVVHKCLLCNSILQIRTPR